MTKRTILFLAANPVGTDRLALVNEARDIQIELERSGHGDQFDLVTRWAAEPLDLLRALRKLRPTVVHFSGHGTFSVAGASRAAAGPNRDVVVKNSPADLAQHGLYFQNSDGRPQIVSAEALAEVFGAAGSSVKLVTLSACYSDPQAEALLAHVDCVVGMCGPIGDDAARSFAIGFYGGLGERESVADAYRQGCAAIKLEGSLEADRPRLRVRAGVDARRVVLAVQASSGPASSRSRRYPWSRAAVGAILVVGIIVVVVRSAVSLADDTSGPAGPTELASAALVVEGVQPAEPSGVATSDSDLDRTPPWAKDSGTDKYGRWAAFEVSGVQQRMRWIPAGTFQMGSPVNEKGRFDDEGPQHLVTLTRGYWLGETEVTQALWRSVMGDNPSHFRGDRPEDPERPVEQVSWDDSQGFIKRLNDKVAGLAARLPTGAEWERACRGGSTTATWAGELSGEVDAPELDSIAWYRGNSGGQTRPVGRKAPNPYGLHDMLGNVWEWCADDQTPYGAATVTDPIGRERHGYRAYRGGAWIDSARNVRAAYHDGLPGNVGLAYLGFRLAGGPLTHRQAGK